MEEFKISLNDETIEKIVDIIIKKININEHKLEKKEQIPIIYINNEKTNTWSSIPPGCRNCSNHPLNGGTGICHCIIGTQTIT